MGNLRLQNASLTRAGLGPSPRRDRPGLRRWSAYEPFRVRPGSSPSVEAVRAQEPGEAPIPYRQESNPVVQGVDLAYRGFRMESDYKKSPTASGTGVMDP
jgi:hypothetical protein